MKSLGSNKYTAPAPDEFEISVFGPGYGECIVVHLGLGDWVIVDSCIEPETKQSVALAYLKLISVNVADSVRAVIATHWDDDHIGGIADLFRAAENAKFVCSRAMESKEFSEILAIWASRRFVTGGSGICQFREVLEEIRRRRKSTRFATPVLASSNIVFFARADKLPAQVKVLAPSDASTVAATARFTKMIASSPGVGRLPPNSGLKRKWRTHPIWATGTPLPLKNAVTRINAYRTYKLEDRDAHDLIIRATDVGACSNRLVPVVLKEWRESRHEVFQERNIWSLFNAFTEALKDGDLAYLPKRTEALHALMDSHVGLAFGRN